MTNFFDWYWNSPPKNRNECIVLIVIKELTLPIKPILNCLFVENVNLVIEKDIDYRHRTHCSILSVFGSPCGERENKRCLWTKTKQTIIRLVNFSLNNEIIGRNIIWPIRAGNQHSNCIGYVNIEMGNVVYRYMIICQYSVSNPNVGCIFITFSLQYTNA